MRQYRKKIDIKAKVYSELESVRSDINNPKPYQHSSSQLNAPLCLKSHICKSKFNWNYGKIGEFHYIVKLKIVEFKFYNVLQLFINHTM